MNFEAFLKQLGTKIAAARRATALKQREASERSGISYRYYQSIEAGRANITMSTLHIIAQCFGVHPQDLIPSRDGGTSPGMPQAAL